jgi:hypothetical protein
MFRTKWKWWNPLTTYRWIRGSHSGDYESSIFWHVTPCSPTETDQYFGRTYSLCLQSWRVNQAKLAAGFTLVSSFPAPEGHRMKIFGCAWSELTDIRSALVKTIVALAMRTGPLEGSYRDPCAQCLGRLEGQLSNRKQSPTWCEAWGDVMNRTARCSPQLPLAVGILTWRALTSCRVSSWSKAVYKYFFNLC